MHWFLDPIRYHYADFKGRASRKEFWMFAVMSALLWLGVMLLVLAAFLVFLSTSTADDLGGVIMAGVAAYGVFILIGLALLVPVTALHVRRLHDIGHSGWWYLLAFIPFGGLVILVFMCLPSQAGANKYGPHPYGQIPQPAAEPIPMPVPLPPVTG